eukprot:COSAG05_NODE_8945_length_659_cov_1.066071_1_plen_104_part_10
MLLSVSVLLTSAVRTSVGQTAYSRTGTAVRVVLTRSSRALQYGTFLCLGRLTAESTRNKREQTNQPHTHTTFGLHPRLEWVSSASQQPLSSLLALSLARCAAHP